jgi:hypothetical protein
MEVYDKEKTDDDLRSLTGISKDEEAAMDTRGHNSVAQDIADREGLASSGAASTGSETPASDNGLYSGGAASVGAASAAKGFFWGSRGRKQATVFGGGGLAGVLIFSIFSLMALSGPAELIQLSETLKIPFSHSEHTDSRLSKRLLRYAKTGNVGETRLGVLGSKIFGNLRTQLSDAGITFQASDSTGRIQSVELDPNKLGKNVSPELQGKSPAEQKALLEQKYNLPSGSLVDVVDSSGAPTGNFTTANGDQLGLKSAIAVKNTAINDLNDGSIISGLKNRVFEKYFGIPSIFHPIKRNVTQPLKDKIAGVITNKLGSNNEQAAADEAQAASDEALATPTPTPTEVTSESKIKDSLSGVSKTAKGLLLFNTATCLARDTAKDIPAINRALIVAPSMAHALTLIALGHQIKTGQDVNPYQLNSALSGLTDSSTGQSVWSARALDATSSPANYSGTIIPVEYAQGFSSSTTSAVIDDTLGGGIFGALVCSSLGQLIQGGLNIGLLASGVFDDGASWGVKAAELAQLGLKQGTKTVLKGSSKFIARIVVTSGVTQLLELHVAELFAAKGVVPKQFAGSLGGNLLAYGARAAANSGALASGAVDLGSTASTLLSYQEAQQANTEFNGKSLAYKLFNPDDRKTVAGHLVDNINPNMSQNVSNVATSLLNFSFITNMTKNLGTIFGSRANADTNQPYDWGFSQYGIPDSLINNPAYDDPYANADTVAKVLDSGGGLSSPYVGKVMDCFGDQITQINGLYSIVPSTDVNPTDVSYLSRDCANLNDPNWARMIMFIEDSRNMDSASCFVGGADSSQSCTNSGFGNGNVSN